VAILAWPACALAGGVAGALSDATSPPDHDDTNVPEGKGDPAAPPGQQPATADRPAPRTVDAAERVRRRADLLRERIERMEKVTPGDVTPVSSLDDADRRVAELREKFEQARADLTRADAEETRRLAERKKAFDTDWSDRAEAIEAGRKPDDVSPYDWAALSDRYFREKADLEADFAASRGRLEGKMDRKVARLEKAVAEAEKLARDAREAWDGLTPGQRKFMSRMLGWKLHRARLLAARQALKELQQVLKDIEGSTEQRDDPLAQEAVESSGYVLPDALRRLVLRELQLADATPYPTPAQLDDGLPLPVTLDPAAGAEAKCRYAAEQLRLAGKGLRDVERDVAREDERTLEFLRELGFSEAEVAAEAERLAGTRPERVAQRAKSLRESTEHWAEELAHQTARWEKPAEPATQPATAPSE
jgi:hypothetical protein